MRKFTAICLVLVLVCGLVGCAGGGRNDQSQYTLSDLLICKAEELARQMGMQAEQTYLTALDFPEEVAAITAVFQQAAADKPVSARVQANVVKTLPQDIIQICSHFAGTEKVAGCGALTVSDQVFLSAKLENPTAVYLRYSENCHFIVVFMPQGDNLASVWAYPLYAEVAEIVLKTYLPAAQELDAKQVQAACKAGSKATFLAQCTDQKTEIGYYAQLVKAVLKQATPLNPKDVAPYTTQQQIATKVVTMSQFMVNGTQAIQVYHFPDSLQAQVDDILKHSSYSRELEAYTRQMVHLTFPQQLCSRYGNDWVTVSSILSSAMDTGNMTATASAEETPVLVLVNLRGGSSLLVSVYPGQHQIYLYRYAVLPIPYPEVNSLLAEMGATKLTK